MKISQLKGLFLAVFLVFASVFAVAQFSPTFRYANFGVSWSYAAVKGKEQKLLLSLTAAEGREVRGHEVQGVVALNEAGKFEAYLEEVCQSAGSEMLFDYRVTQVQSEQFDWNQPTGGKLANLRWNARIQPRGPLNDFVVSDKSSSLWSRKSVGAAWLSSLWPGLPNGRLRLGSTWSKQVEIRCNLPEYPEGIPLRCKCDYRWDSVRKDTGKTMLEYSWTGSMAGGGDSDISGQITGKGIYNLDEQRIQAAEFRYEFQGRQPLNVPGSQESAVSVAVHQVCSGRIVREVPAKP